MKTTDADLLDLGFETNKIKLQRSTERFNAYRYAGFMNRVGGEKLAAFPAMVRFAGENDDLFEHMDAAQSEARGLTLQEIMDGDTSANRLLYSTTVNAPDGLIASDPCSIKPESTIEPGVWDITFKGFHQPSEASNVEHGPIEERPNGSLLPSIFVEGFSITQYRPSASTIWIVRPGAEFSTASKEPVFSIDIDSGMVGLFPLHLNLDIPAWDANNPFLSVAYKDVVDPIYTIDRGLFADTIMGDLTCFGYSLHDENGEKVGYVISTSSVLPHENNEDEDSEYLREQEESLADILAGKTLLLGIQGDITVTSEITPFTKNHLTGTIDDMKFSLEYDYDERGYRLRIGVTDLEYRRKAEEGVAKRGLTKNGVPYRIEWNDNYPERKLYEVRRPGPVVYGPDLLRVLADMIREPQDIIEEGYQLFW